jgi:putative glutamine amidotransferase
MVATGSPRKPRVLVPACHRVLDGHATYCVGQKYITAVELAGAQPRIVHACDPAELPALLDEIDGVLLTGSPSNVHPRHFGQAVHDASLPLDAARDRWILPLVVQAAARGVPLLGICRGLQEINVAFGGSLHQAVHERDGGAPHITPHAEPAVAYAPAHAVDVMAGGLLEQLLGGMPRIEVNSVHRQGIARLASGLRVEARAADGLVEAVSKPDAAAFLLGVQWHPEWCAEDNPVSMRLLQAFGEACRGHAARAV